MNQVSIFAPITPNSILTIDDLVEPHDFRAVIQDIHNYLAANASNVTRSEKLSQQVIIMLFCKLYDELHTSRDNALVVQRMPEESPQEMAKRLTTFFRTQVKTSYSSIFERSDDVELDHESIQYIVSRIQQFRLLNSHRDIIGDAFEALIGYDLKGSKGQFFTPRNAVQMMVTMVDPRPGERILDPACGSGGFLTMVLRHLQNIESDSAEFRGCVVGIDKDEYLSRVANTYTQLLNPDISRVFSENSLASPNSWSTNAKQLLQLESFDVILTNPPFGEKLKIREKDILEQYSLAHKWAKDKTTGIFVKSNATTASSPQLLFIERCLQFLKVGGRLGIVLPETVLGNPSYEYVVQYLQRHMTIRAIVSMPEELFQPYTHAKSCVVVGIKEKTTSDNKIFMGIAKWCGHDSRGNPTIQVNPNTGEKVLLDDIPQIAHKYIEQLGNGHTRTRLGFTIRQSDIRGNILIPKYYDPEVDNALLLLSQTHDLISIDSLVQEKIVSVKTGVEIGKLSYGTGEIPFIRTSDITNWELKIDAKHCVSEAIYQRYAKQAEVQPEDILMVRDGTYLIGTSCILSKYDIKILFQSHIYRIRVLKRDKLDPYLLFAALNSRIVKRQIKAKQFTQHVIDTLGSRINEVVLPIPRDVSLRNQIIEQVKEIVETRAALRHQAREVVMSLEGVTSTKDDSELDIL